MRRASDRNRTCNLMFTRHLLCLIELRRLGTSEDAFILQTFGQLLREDGFGIPQELLAALGAEDHVTIISDLDLKMTGLYDASSFFISFSALVVQVTVHITLPPANVRSPHLR